MLASFIPTPTVSQFSVGPLTIHAYALCIITGVAVAIWLGDKRYRNMGGQSGVVSDLAIWVVPAGVIGGRLYHAVSYTHLTLPWALEIPRWLRPDVNVATYHPTFLYEAIGNFILAFILIKLTGKYKAGSIFVLYVAGYCTYRFFIEGLRVDTAHSFLHLRLNQWVSAVVGLAAYAKFVIANKIKEK